MSWSPARGAVACALCTGFACRAQPPAVTFRNTFAVAGTATDQHGAPFTVTGLSGVSYRGVDSVGLHRFLAVMDNSDKLIDLGVTINGSGAVTSVTILAGLTLAESRDFEGVIAMPGSAHTVVLAEEGTPALREYDLSTGAPVGTFPAVAVFANRRANFGFESAARAFGGAAFWTANEEALTTDGPLSTPSAGTWVRLQRFASGPGGRTPNGQFAYQTAPMHGSAISGSRSGVSEIVTMPDGRLLTLERSFAGPFPSFQSRIYEVTIGAATDVSALGALAGQAFTPVTKALLYQGNQANMEGLCVGPLLAPGTWSLIGIVDDGDHVLSTNRLVAFTISGIAADEPCAADYNGDGFVTGEDFDSFVVRFEAGDDAADFDLNSFVNGDDFDRFIVRFEAGC